MASDIERDHLAERAMAISDRVFGAWSAMKERFREIGDVRRCGAMLGIEFVVDPKTKEPNTALAAKITEESMRHGLITMRSGIYENVIRFLCPLVVTDKQIEAGLAIFEKAVIKSIEEQRNGC